MCDNDGLVDNELEERFIGKYFLLTDCYVDEHGMWREGFAGMIKAAVGRDSYLIQACKGFKQHVVHSEFVIESRMLIFDTFDELKEAKEQRYPPKKGTHT